MKRRIHISIMILSFIACGCLPGNTLAAENRGQATPPDALPRDLAGIAVKDYFIPANAREVGLIQTVMAHVVVAKGDLSQAYFAVNGDKLYEKDIIFTLKASKCRIKLHNEDIITLGENARLAINEAAGTRDTPEKKSALSLLRGKAMFYALRLLNHKGLSMTVESQTAVVGVRGTKFGVDVAAAGENTMGALPLLLADRSEDWGRYLLAQASQTGGTTTVHGFDGTVTVTSTIAGGGAATVTPGQSITVTGQGLGTLAPTPPQVSQSFQSLTNVPPPGGSGGGSSQAPAGGTGGGQAIAGGTVVIAGTTGTPPLPPNLPNPNEPPSTAPQQPLVPDPVPDPKTNTSGSHVGYFSAMLTNATAHALEEVFVSQNRYDGDQGVWARGTKTAEDFVRAQGNGQQFSGSPNLKWVTFGSGTKGSGDLANGYPVSTTTITRFSYLEWGYATVPQSFPADGSNYVFDNRIYWLFGANTPAATLAGLTGTAAYSGKAYGTYWSAGGGANLTGTFRSNVNFAASTNQISNFSYSVQDKTSSPTVQASITGASGTIGTDAHFTINPGTGVWDLNGATPDQKSAVGSVYGANADSLGGVLGMYNSVLKTGLSGSFQGDKPFAVQQGVITGMLERADGTYIDTYSSSPQSFTSASATASTATSPAAPLARSITVDGSSGTGDKFMTALETATGTWLGNRSMQFTKIDANAYTEWGTWTQPTAMTVIITAGVTADYDFKNEGWYLWGNQATEADMVALRASGLTPTYNGNAYGTFFTGGGPGTRLTGTFNTTVNFAAATNQINNFNVNVTGGGNSVQILGASGSFAGSTSNFNIDQATGNWILNGANVANSNPPDKAASGAIYGPAAQAIGGSWQVREGANRAAGVFQGTR